MLYDKLKTASRLRELRLEKGYTMQELDREVNRKVNLKFNRKQRKLD